jgi:hypothetical protein
MQEYDSKCLKMYLITLKKGIGAPCAPLVSTASAPLRLERFNHNLPFRKTSNNFPLFAYFVICCSVELFLGNCTIFSDVPGMSFSCTTDRFRKKILLWGNSPVKGTMSLFTSSYLPLNQRSHQNELPVHFHVQ